MTNNLETQIRINAPVDQVWPVVSDLTRMPEWSPQCRRVLTKGALRQGSFMINLNRHGSALWWPTRAKVTDYSHLQRIAWKVLDNGTEWSFTLTPEGDATVVTERRDVPAGGTSKISQLLVDKFFGGEEDFEAALVTGMNQTLQRVRDSIEGPGPRST